MHPQAAARRASSAEGQVGAPFRIINVRRHLTEAIVHQVYSVSAIKLNPFPLAL